jgi:hypothetical protein
MIPALPAFAEEESAKGDDPADTVDGWEADTAGDHNEPKENWIAWLFCFPEGRHLIFYIMTDNAVDVIGIPHQSMDVPLHLKD